MTRGPEHRDDLYRLIDALFDDRLDAADHDRLAALLDTDDDALRLYVAEMNLHANLLWDFRAEQADDAEVVGEFPVADGLPPAGCTGSTLLLGVPPIQCESDHSPVFGFFGRATSAMTGFATSGWPVAYLVSMVVLVAGAFLAAVTYVSRPLPNAGDAGSIAVRAATLTSAVARITETADCRWTDPQDAPTTHFVSLGDRIALDSGLLEITYDTGAKVILQGPATYTVETTNGGFLAVGRLTGMVETPQARGFAVRTPTALVTDLGTEFAVEVDRQGGTTSHVFRGSVYVRTIATEGTAQGIGQTLQANQSARIEAAGEKGITVFASPTRNVSFVHSMPKQTVKTLDLVDVIAAGDGFSGHRNGFIDPTTGALSEIPNPVPQSFAEYLRGDGTYHPVESLPMVDGVFIPDGAAGPVQVDSAGHVFDGFGATANCTSEFLWAGNRCPEGREFVQTKLGEIDFATADHTMLFLQSNTGITFDLDAMRKSNPGYRIERFRCMVGNTETESQKGIEVSADVWILVDGQLRYKRREINGYSGATLPDVVLHDDDRFLTLVATDGFKETVTDDNRDSSCAAISYDWILFGDPRLELKPAGVRDRAGGGDEK